MRAPDELGLQYEVLRRIAGQLQLGAQQQVGVLCPAPHLEHRGGIAIEVADALVHLRKRDPQAVSHGGDLASRPQAATFTGPRPRR
jgi:hypothetical protein